MMTYNQIVQKMEQELDVVVGRPNLVVLLTYLSHCLPHPAKFLVDIYETRLDHRGFVDRRFDPVH